MVNDTKRNPGERIDIHLGELFGSLGSALSELLSRLEAGQAGAFEREHEFQTEKGPVRTYTGMRIRVGGLPAGAASKSRPKPVNPGRPKPDESENRSQTRSISYELFEDGQAWILTADIPGVSLENLSVSLDERLLRIRTDGRRNYQTDIELERPADPESLVTSLNNGILELRFRDAEEER